MSSNEQDQRVAEIIRLLFKTVKDFIRSNKIVLIEEHPSILGSDSGSNIEILSVIDDLLAASYGKMKEEGFLDPINSIDMFFLSGNFKSVVGDDLLILMMISQRNFDTHSKVYCYKNKIYSDHSNEELIRILFSRKILKKKAA